MIAFRMKLQVANKPNSVSFLLLWQAPALLLSTFSGKTTVKSDVEERVAEEHLAWNDKNIQAWPKNISVL